MLQVKLEDVHPSIEVVDAFREVSDAFEEKSRLINEAEGYSNEQIALARGNASRDAAKCQCIPGGAHGARQRRCQPLRFCRSRLSPGARRNRRRASISRPLSRCFPAETS